MKQIALSGNPNLDNLSVRDVDIPVPVKNQIVVKVAASSANFHDYMVLTGIRPTANGRVPLSDGVGQIVARGAEATEFALGERVMGTFFPDWTSGPATAKKIARMRGEQLDGFACEYFVATEAEVTRAPINLSDIEAATLPCAALTAWRSLVVEGKIRPGDYVLVEGTGGLSLFALQFAKMVGAKVIATSSSDDKLERLKHLGADHVLNYVSSPRWGREVLSVTDGAGVDHIVEVGGGDLSETLAAAAIGCKVYGAGVLSGKAFQVSPEHLIGKNLRIIGITVGSREHQEDMVKAIETNGLKPVVDSIHRMQDLGDAFRHLSSKRHFGKICLAW